MFKFCAKIPNLFYDPTKEYVSKIYFHAEPRITKNKSLNFQISRWEPYDLFEFNLDISLFRQDHAGFRFNFQIYGFEINLDFYDNRHWNYETDDWE